MIGAGYQFYNMVSMWPQDGEHVRVVIFAENDFQWKSCLSQWRDEDHKEAKEVLDEAINEVGEA